ncbi:MAG: hypothetical protein HOW73_24800 [Polyangiaceae bacterium]|nr:hypothetical protein [Polyangiaceae bacterium]
MPNWRDELIDAVKTRVERDAEEAAKHKQRVLEALASAETALGLAIEALKFGHERIAEKGQDAKFLDETEEVASDGDLPGGKRTKLARLSLGNLSVAIELDRATAVIKVSFLEGKPREFDFARDRHIAAADVEDYVGRRVVELVRSAQKASPW